MYNFNKFLINSDYFVFACIGTRIKSTLIILMFMNVNADKRKNREYTLNNTRYRLCNK